MTAVFQIFKFATAMAVQSGAYESDLQELGNLAAGENADRDAFIQKIETLNKPALAKLQLGNGQLMSALWQSVVASEAPKEWKIDGLQPVLADLYEIRASQHHKTGTHLDDAWMMVFETIFSKTEFLVLVKLKMFFKIPPDYFVLAIANDQGKRASRWWYSIGDQHKTCFINCLKDTNRHIRFLKAGVNPDNVEASEIDARRRLRIIRAYVSHPFSHQIQPFNSNLFQQLINIKCLTVEEVFADPEAWVTLHPRQGLAYLDIARLYRKNGQFPKALAALNEGMTTRLQTGNRLAHFLLERAKIYRDAGRLEAAQRSLDSVDVNQLDDNNLRLIEEIEESLE